MSTNLPTDNIMKFKYSMRDIVAINAIETIAEQIRSFVENYPSFDEIENEDVDPDRTYAFLIAKLKYLGKVTRACYAENNWRFNFEYAPASGIQASVMPANEYYRNYAGGEPNEESDAGTLSGVNVQLEMMLSNDGTNLFDLLVSRCRRLAEKSYKDQVFDDDLYLICCDFNAWIKYVDRWQGWIHVHNVIGHPDRWSVKVVLPDDAGNYRPIDL